MPNHRHTLAIAGIAIASLCAGSAMALDQVQVGANTLTRLQSCISARTADHEAYTAALTDIQGTPASAVGLLASCEAENTTLEARVGSLDTAILQRQARYVSAQGKASKLVKRLHRLMRSERDISRRERLTDALADAEQLDVLLGQLTE